LGAPAGLAGAPGKPVPCPICKLPLFPAQLGGQEMLHCAECKGNAFKREALMKLQPHGEKTLDTGPEARAYKRPPFFEPRKKPPFLICPFCVKRMKETKLGPANVDLCESCQSLWLDGPKLGQLNELIGPYKWRMSKAK
jgi:Zn-finger nucleic acid-binding protein